MIFPSFNEARILKKVRPFNHKHTYLCGIGSMLKSPRRCPLYMLFSDMVILYSLVDAVLQQSTLLASFQTGTLVLVLGWSWTVRVADNTERVLFSLEGQLLYHTLAKTLDHTNSVVCWCFSVRSLWSSWVISITLKVLSIPASIFCFTVPLLPLSPHLLACSHHNYCRRWVYLHGRHLSLLTIVVGSGWLQRQRLTVLAAGTLHKIPLVLQGKAIDVPETK